ncbi:DUF2178 domain-containing protein [Candidatus Woesebacteria bacterium]|nr:DUF2178 domain-containing protein [Candidatus Woesebacteria bacterium]
MDLTSEQFEKIRKILTFLEIIVVLLAVNFNSALIAIFGIGFGMFILTFLKSSVKDKLIDERIESIANRAAMVSFRVMLPILGLTSVALLVSAGKEEFYFLHGLGVILSYITCLGLFIYLVTYYYFNKKYGG